MNIDQNAYFRVYQSLKFNSQSSFLHSLDFSPISRYFTISKNCGGCMISEEEKEGAFNLLDEELFFSQENNRLRELLCCLLISGATDVFDTRIAFKQASGISDKTIRNKVWAYAMQTGARIRRKSNLDDREDLCLMETIFNENIGK